jgi:Leucine-rich repeat (LRR) protein
MKKYGLLFLIFLMAQSGMSQFVVTPQKPMSYPYFASSEDSTAYAQIGRQLMEAYKTKNVDNKVIDSLSPLYSSLYKKITSTKFYYQPSDEFTAWEKVVELNMYDEVKLISFSSSSTSLPKELLQCKNLEAIEFVNTRIHKLPRELSKLEKLHTLAVYDSKVNFKIVKNAKLRTVIVRGGKNQNRFKQFSNLEKLDLSSCSLTALPKKLHKNKKLKELLLNENLVDLSKTKIKTHHQITKIELQRNGLKEIPASIAMFPNVKTLVFNGNEINNISPAMGKLVKLEQLSFYKNNLITLPEAIYTLANLKEIDLYYNQLERLDDRIGTLKNLQVLYLSNNRLVGIPESIGSLTNLEELYLSNNRLSELPNSLANLDKLKVLRVNNNYLGQAPYYLPKLSSLENLDISSNQISELPDGISDLPYLKLLVIQNNPWDDSTLTKLPMVTAKLRNKEVVVHVNE